LIAAIKSFLLAAVSAAAIGILIMLCYTVVSAGTDARWATSDLRFFGFFFVSFFVISLIALGLLVVPATLLLAKIKGERWWVYPSLGFVCAIAILPLFGDVFRRDLPFADVLAALGFGAAGAVAGSIWWRGFRKNYAGTN